MNLETTTYRNHNTYGGLIGFSDFCTDYPRNEKKRSIADKIASDWRFDEQCRKNCESRNRMENR